MVINNKDVIWKTVSLKKDIISNTPETMSKYIIIEFLATPFFFFRKKSILSKKENYTVFYQ
jgi:hypothetical protein